MRLRDPEGGELSLEADVGKPLLDVLRDVVLDPAEQAAFTNDPASYLGQYGYDDVAADDLSEAFGLVADTLPPDIAQAVAAAAPAPPPVAEGEGDGEFAVGEGDGATFGDVNGDFDALALGGPDTAPEVDDDDAADFDALDDRIPDTQPPPDGDRAAEAGFGAGSADLGLDVDLDGDRPLDIDTAWADTEVPTDDFADDALGGPDTFTDDVTSEADDYGRGGHDDVDDLDDGGLGDDPGDFLDDVGSF